MMSISYIDIRMSLATLIFLISLFTEFTPVVSLTLRYYARTQNSNGVWGGYTVMYGCNPGQYVAPPTNAYDLARWENGDWWRGICVACPVNRYCPGGYGYPHKGNDTIPASAQTSNSCTNNTVLVNSTHTQRKLCDSCSAGYYTTWTT
jgi:hypothetical protein